MTTTERIDAILKSRGMSRRQVAIAAKIPPSTLQSAMERGKNISVDMLQRIASALNVPVSELLGTVDEIDARITQKLQDAKKSLEEGKTSESEWEKRVAWANAMSSIGDAAQEAANRDAVAAENAENHAENQREVLAALQELNHVGRQEALKRIKEMAYVPDYQKEKAPPAAPQEAPEGE